MSIWLMVWVNVPIHQSVNPKLDILKHPESVPVPLASSVKRVRIVQLKIQHVWTLETANINMVHVITTKNAFAQMMSPIHCVTLTQDSIAIWMGHVQKLLLNYVILGSIL